MKPKQILFTACGAFVVLLGVVSYAYRDLAREVRQQERAAYASGILEGMKAKAHADSSALSACLRQNRGLRMSVNVMRQRARLQRRVDE